MKLSLGDLPEHGWKTMRPFSQAARPCLYSMVSCLLVLLGSVATAQPPPPAARSRSGFTEPRTQRWVVGLQVQSPGTASGIIGTMTVPMSWPEQEVVVVETRKTSHVSSIRYRTITGNVRQMVVLVSRLKAGETAEVMVTFEITRSVMTAPQETTDLVIPAEPPAAVRRYLSASPGIELRDPKIQQLSREIGTEGLNDWQQAEALYDWVRENIRYRFDEQLRGARAALESRQGDCEELTSLFIALCRARGIPARSVWIPGHCYAEFYMQDAEGHGHWFPCQSAGTRAFGAMPEYRPVLQKGDNIRVPGISRPQRYVGDMLKAKVVTAALNVKFTRHRVEPAENP